MTIEEAIAHCYDVANGKYNQCDECRQEHLQLAKWLEELRTLRKEKFHKGGDRNSTRKNF